METISEIQLLLRRVGTCRDNAAVTRRVTRGYSAEARRSFEEQTARLHEQACSLEEEAQRLADRLALSRRPVGSQAEEARLILWLARG
ncbi:MAG: hypothetical protein EPO67_17360 [Reyranella sp.]|jgi:hypothetical protein|nr:MAG: hypothetical protein EPO67_17360 [Reyranella sp.]